MGNQCGRCSQGAERTLYLCILDDGNVFVVVFVCWVHSNYAESQGFILFNGHRDHPKTHFLSVSVEQGVATFV